MDHELKAKFANTNAMKNYLAGNNPDQDFYELSSACMSEVFGKLTKEQFRGNSDMALWFAQRHNIIREILAESQKSEFKKD